MRLWPMVMGAVAAAAVLGAPLARAQPVPDARAAELSAGLNAHTISLARDRFALAAGPLTGATPRGGVRFSVRLWAGQEYVFAGVCDSACGDLNMRVIDRRGVVLAQDDDAPAPVLRVTPTITGQHVIEARPAQCRADTCWLAVNVYAR
jgi:hypothetical protein